MAGEINAFLRGHYAYYGVAGIAKVYRAVERYWRGMLRSRSRAARCLIWEKYRPTVAAQQATLPALEELLRRWLF